MNNDAGPAFPITAEQSNNGISPSPGMSLRDYFAAAAMQALIARETQNDEVWNSDRDEDSFEAAVATRAFWYSDAMIEERDSGSLRQRSTEKAK
jgi:hypothetical protein